MLSLQLEENLSGKNVKSDFAKEDRTKPPKSKNLLF